MLKIKKNGLLPVCILGLAIALAMGGGTLRGYAQTDANTTTDTDAQELLLMELDPQFNHCGAYVSAGLSSNGISVASLDTKTVLTARIGEALENGEFSIDISDLGLSHSTETAELITEILEDLINVTYRYFYIGGAYYQYNTSLQVQTLTLTCTEDYQLADGSGDPDTEKIAADLAVLQEAMEQALETITIDTAMSDVEIVLAVHDYIVSICTYDYENYINGTVPDASYNSWGVLIEGTAVCQGYAEVFSSLMYELGIESYLVASDTMNHIWNMVYVDGAWYHVDTTWDDPVMTGETARGYVNNDTEDEGYISHDFFLKSDAEFLEAQHSDWDADVPAAEKSGSFAGYCFYEMDAAMNYYASYWYYVDPQDSSCIQRAKIDGSDASEIALQEEAFYLFSIGDVLYFSNADGVYTYEVTAGEEAQYLDVQTVYPGYMLTEFAIRQETLIGVLTDGSSFVRTQLSSTEVMLAAASTGSGSTDDTGGSDSDSTQETEGGSSQDTIQESGQTGSADETTQQEQSLAEIFVERLYTCLLGRSSDAAGLAGWVSLLEEGSTAAEVVQGFVNSVEFLALDTDDETYVTCLYRALLGRTPDSGGLQNWLQLLADGMSRQYVLCGIIQSEEFAQVCSDFGITCGSLTLTEAADQNYGVTAYVVRLYRQCLSREPDASGLTYWCTQLLNETNTAGVTAYGFFFSEEFLSRTLSDEEYVYLLYAVLLNREPDSGGLQNWLDALAVGRSREYVFDGFIASEEFSSFCSLYGLE